jgi:CubicO group peptidase (beta-lactamase class C family)
MLKTFPFRCGVLRVISAALPAVLVAATAAAERPVEGRPSGRKLSPQKVVLSLGPGPLPPGQPVAGVTPLTPKASSVEEGIDQCVEANMARLNAPGAAVAVILDGETLYESGYGVKRRGTDNAVDPDTVFRIGSVTKQMTAAAVMQQVELGRVDLDAPVTRYIPEFEVGGRWSADRIKVRHALTHTTGFPDRITDLFLVGNDALSTWAGRQSQIELHAPPGSFWNYSNPNFMIAGLVAERASGMPYRDLFKENLWEPAEMYATTFDPSEVVRSGNYSYGHYYDTEGNREIVVGPHDNDLWAAGPAGFAFSTVRDLARWALLLTDGGGAVLSWASTNAMQHPHQWMHYRPDQYYGFGVMIERYNGLDVRQHGGNVAGYGTYLLWVPDRRFVVALLSNVTSSLTTAAYCIVDGVLDPMPVEPPDLTTPPSTWRSYVGDFKVTDNEGVVTRATVQLEGDELSVSVVDPEPPHDIVTSRLEQLFLDTFLFDSDGDGAGDNDLTFCSTRGNPGIVMWLRNRLAVGERQLRPRTARRAAVP